MHYDLAAPFNSTIGEGGLEKHRRIGVCETIVTASACVVFVDTVGVSWLKEYVEILYPLPHPQEQIAFQDIG